MDSDNKLWEFPSMLAVKVDSTKRIRLRCAAPGDYYAVEMETAGVIRLRKTAPPAPKRPTTAASARRAILASRLDLGGSYEALRAMTRE